jgi:hypothetical protein
VYLWHVFLIKPLAGISILICLATILSLFSLERRRPHSSLDRFLIGFLGLLSVYQGLRVLQSAGLVTISANTKLDDAIDLIVTMFYLLAAVLLRMWNGNRMDAESAMRLAQAAPPRSSRADAAMEAPQPVNSLERLRWMLPKVSDGAFKLYAYFSIYADPTQGRISSTEEELRLGVGKSEEEVRQYLRELERTAEISVLQSGGRITVDLNGRPSAPPPDENTAALSAIRS